ncbi:MAG: hypothetical protein JST00_33945 [Deltaproteobacteria bacterium]|nr:hypothetical protein [Deltaproteobacteria bacterium]
MKPLRRIAIGCALAFSAYATRASAEADTFGVGSGRSGPGSITAADSIVNAYAPITTAVAAGATKLIAGTVEGAGAFAAGDLVLVWQARGGHASPLVSGDPTALTLGATSTTGHYELARVLRVTELPDTTREIELTFPLVTSFDAGASQIVRVPEYASLAISAGASITPLAWNGSIGGIAVVFVRGTLQNDGALDGSARGFRGGRTERFDAPSPFSRGCTALDGRDPNVAGSNPAGGGATKGEGTDPSAYAESVPSPEPRHYGRGNVGAGGGGGNCANAGGGGGGGSGRGGLGGASRPGDGLRPVGGLGGVATSITSTSTHLVCGGGGGSGHDNERLPDASREGHGGAVLLVRAKSITGAGTFVSDGRSITAAPNTDGGSGGGAGGTIVLSTTAPATCTRVSARGGRGQDATGQRGAGGGGGGGLVVVRPAPAAPCALEVTGGAGGVSGSDGAAGDVGTTSTGGVVVADDCQPSTGRCGGCLTDAECTGGSRCSPISHACESGEPAVDASAPDASVDAAPDAAPPVVDASVDAAAPPSPPPPPDPEGSIEGAGGCEVQRRSGADVGLLASIALVVALRAARRRARRRG